MVGAGGAAPPATVEITYCCATAQPLRTSKKRARIAFVHITIRSRRSRKSRNNTSGCNCSNSPGGVMPVFTEMARSRLARAASISCGASPMRDTWRLASDPSIVARMPQRDARQSRREWTPSHQTHRNESNSQAGSLQFAPADPREISCHQSEQHAAARQPLQHRHHAGTVLVQQRRAHAKIVALRPRAALPAWPRESPAKARPTLSSSRSRSPGRACPAPGYLRWWCGAR